MYFIVFSGIFFNQVTQESEKQEPHAPNRADEKEKKIYIRLDCLVSFVKERKFVL